LSGVITLDLSGMGGPTSSIRYRQHSSWDHVTTQAPPLRQSRDTFGGFTKISRWIILRMFQTKVVEKIKTHILCSVTLCENGAVCEIMWNNTVERDKPQMTIWRMRIACWITKATNTHSEYVIFIAFTLQQWLYEGTSMLRYTYIACHATSPNPS
jgi:hypothetical protein